MKYLKVLTKIQIINQAILTQLTGLIKEDELSMLKIERLPDERYRVEYTYKTHEEKLMYKTKKSFLVNICNKISDLSMALLTKKEYNLKMSCNFIKEEFNFLVENDELGINDTIDDITLFKDRIEDVRVMLNKLNLNIINIPNLYLKTTQCPTNVEKVRAEDILNMLLELV